MLLRAIFNTDFAQIRHISRGFSERFLSHTDLTDTNRLIYSADAMVNTDRHKIFGADWHNSVEICENIM